MLIGLLLLGDYLFRNKVVSNNWWSLVMVSDGNNFNGRYQIFTFYEKSVTVKIFCYEKNFSKNTSRFGLFKKY